MKQYILTTAILATLAAPAVAGGKNGNNGVGNQCQGNSCGTGAQGIPGATGPAGPAGARGPAGSSGDHINAAAIGALELLDPTPGGWTGGIGVTGSEGNASAALGIGYGTSANTMLYGKLASDGKDALGSVGFSFRF